MVSKRALALITHENKIQTEVGGTCPSHHRDIDFDGVGVPWQLESKREMRIDVEGQGGF